MMAVLFAGSMMATDVTVTKTVYDLYPNDANGTQECTLYSDDVLTISVNCDGNNGKIYGTGTEWRTYQSNSAVITVAATDATIKTVKFTFTVNKNGTLNFGEATLTTDVAVDVNASSAEFTVGNSTTATNGQIIIKGFEVVYETEGGDPAEKTPAELLAEYITDFSNVAGFINQFDAQTAGEILAVVASAQQALDDNNEQLIAYYVSYAETAKAQYKEEILEFASDYVNSLVPDLENLCSDEECRALVNQLNQDIIEVMATEWDDTKSISDNIFPLVNQCIALYEEAYNEITFEAPTTCEQASRMVLALENNAKLHKGENFTLEGYVTEIAYAWSDNNANMSFWMADTQDGGQVIQAYRATKAEGEENVPVVGDYVSVTGVLVKYVKNATTDPVPEFAAGCTFEIKNAPAPEKTYYLVGDFNNWEPSDNYVFALNTASESDAEYMITIFLAEANAVKVQDSEGEWYPGNCDNLTLAAGENVLYFRPNYDGGDDWYCGTLLAVNNSPEVYSVVGSEEIFGNAWDPTDAETEMSFDNDEQLYKLIVDAELCPGEYKLKVVKDHAWANNWPEENYPINIVEAGTYTITIYFDPAEGGTVRAAAERVEDYDGCDEPAQDVYTLAGATELFGANWDIVDANDANRMVLSDDPTAVTYTLTKENVLLAAGIAYEYKVVLNHAWGDGEFPANGNYDVSVQADGYYDVTFYYIPGQTLYAETTWVKAAEVEKHYTLVSDINGWDPSLEANLMEKGDGNDEGLYLFTISNVELYRMGYGYKVVEFGSWTEYYPNNAGSNAHFTVDARGTYDITFKFDPAMPNCEVVTELVEEYEPIYEDGYYLVRESNEYELQPEEFFRPNLSATGDGEYMLATSLEAGDKIQVLLVEDDVLLVSFPDAQSVLEVDADHAGEVTVYFNELGEGDDDWFMGYLKIVKEEQQQPEDVAFYLVGTMFDSGWEIAEDGRYKFEATDIEGEYWLRETIAGGDECKVRGVDVTGAPNGWYPDNYDNFVIPGEKDDPMSLDIFFRPNGDGGEGWYGGCILTRPQINLWGGFSEDDWTLDRIMNVNDNKTEASYVLTIDEPGEYQFVVQVAGDARSLCGEDGNMMYQFTRTRHFGNDILDRCEDTGANMALVADVAGTYVAHWDYSANTLWFDFPEKEVETQEIRIYPGIWAQYADYATVAAWAWTGNEIGQWYDIVMAEDDLWSTWVPADAENIIFAVFPATAGVEWGKEIVQTPNLEIPECREFYINSGYDYSWCEPATMVSLTILDLLGWDQVWAFAWNDNFQSNGDFPGIQLNPIRPNGAPARANEEGTMYRFECSDRFQYIVFSNGIVGEGGKQTIDLNWSAENLDQRIFVLKGEANDGGLYDQGEWKKELPSAIENIDINTMEAVKVLENGQILIIKNGKIFNITGQVVR